MNRLRKETTTWYETDKRDTTVYRVVVNYEERYSIWPERKETPLGWRDTGKAGSRAECLDYIRSLD